MAAQIGSLYVDLTMNARGFVAGMQNASAATNRAVGAINRDLGLAERSVKRFSSGGQNFKPYAIIAASRAYESAADRSNLLRGALLSLTTVAGGLTAALSTNIISRYADTAVNLANQLRTVTTSSSNLAAIQDQLTQVTERSRSSLQSTVTLYARTARASETLGLSQQKLLRITETIQKAFAIGGATSAEAQGAAIQLSQGIASDRFSGEEFRSVAENAPVLLRGMAESLGVNIGKLRELAQEGVLTADVVTQAILKASTRIDKEFGTTVINLDQAITQVDNKILEYIGNTDKAYGITNLLANGIVTFGDSLSQIIPPLTNIVALLGAMALARNKAALGGGLGAVIGGAAGLALGGTSGAIYGAALGGSAGFFSQQADKTGLGFIGRIKADAAASREEVVRLSEATKELRNLSSAARLDLAKAKGLAAGNVADLAPASSKSGVAREQLAIEKLDARKIDLLEKQRETYLKLAQVSSQMTPRAAKLADTQLKVELKLNETLAAQAGLKQQITSIGADARALAAVEGSTYTASKEDIAAKTRATKALSALELSAAKQKESIQERNGRLQALSSAADQKAAAARAVITQQIIAQTNELNKLDGERLVQTQALGKAKAQAEAAGRSIAAAGIEQARVNYVGLRNALEGMAGRLDLAKKASTGFSIAMRAVGSSVNSLVGLFGGPWGVAITAASLIFTKFAADAQASAQKIAIAKGLISESLQTTGNDIAPGGAGSVLSTEVEAIKTQIKEITDGADEAFNALRGIFGLSDLNRTDPLTEMARAMRNLMSIPIREKLNDLQELTNQFVSGDIKVAEFTTRLEAMKTEVNNSAFSEAADKVLQYANVLAGAQPAVDALRQKIVDLQTAAANPINVVVTATFDALDAQPVDAKLSGALSQFAPALNYTRELDKELSTLRLVGDARKKAEYTDAELTKAEKAGVVITDAIRSKIAAYVNEKIALENRDAAVKKSLKDDPYEKATKSLKEKTDAMALENSTYGQTTFAIEKAKAYRELENAAIEAHMKLTPELVASMNAQADAYARQAEISTDLREQFEFYQGTFSSFWTDMKNNLLEGQSLWGSLGNAAVSALNKIADRALGIAADGIFNLLFGAMFGGMGGSLPTASSLGKTGFYGWELFSGGGFTGSGGKYQPAGVVHRGEYVFDQDAVRRIGVGNLEMLRQGVGYADGGYVGGTVPGIGGGQSSGGNQISFAPVINGGGSMSGRELKDALKTAYGEWKKELPKMLADARRRGAM